MPRGERRREGANYKLKKVQRSGKQRVSGNAVVPIRRSEEDHPDDGDAFSLQQGAEADWVGCTYNIYTHEPKVLIPGVNQERSLARQLMLWMHERRTHVYMYFAIQNVMLAAL